jgi:hypothetical protein
MAGPRGCRLQLQFRPMKKNTPRLRAADLLKRRNVPVAQAVRALKREPTHPVTCALKLWGDDEDPFRHLITSRTAAARVWRETMAVVLRNLTPEVSGRTVWRGWYFDSAGARQQLLGRLEKTGRFLNRRIGMSASRSRGVASRPEFVNRYGALWEIRHPYSARDLAPVFRVIGAKHPWQREVIFPRGSCFRLLRPPGWLTISRGGQTFKVRHYVLQETP